MEGSLETNPWPKASIFSGIAVCTLLAGALVVWNGIKPVPVETPTKFAQYKSSDGNFRCDYPDGWSKHGRSLQAVTSGASFSKGSASISAMADLQGSLIADIAKAPGGGMAGIELPGNLAGQAGLAGAMAAAQKPPVQIVHEKEAKNAEEKLEVSNYAEKETKPFTTRLGEGRYTEFTGDAPFPKGAMHGYRATILGNDRAVYVYCSCAEADWPKLEKAFLRVIGSVNPPQ